MGTSASPTDRSRLRQRPRPHAGAGTFTGSSAMRHRRWCARWRTRWCPKAWSTSDTYLSLDDCWSAKTRNATGHLQPDPKQFPNGMAPSPTCHEEPVVRPVQARRRRPARLVWQLRARRQTPRRGASTSLRWIVGYPGGNRAAEMSRALNATGARSSSRSARGARPTCGIGAASTLGRAATPEWMADLVPSKWTKQYGCGRCFAALNYVNSRRIPSTARRLASTKSAPS